MAYPRFRRARAHKIIRRTFATVTLNSTTWADVDTGMDLAVPAQVGDVIEVGVNGVSGTEAVTAFLDVGFLVSAAIARSVGSGELTTTTGDGIPGWGLASGVASRIGPPAHVTLASSDIDGGIVTCRLRYRTNAASDKTLLATAASPLLFYVKNLGPAAE